MARPEGVVDDFGDHGTYCRGVFIRAGEKGVDVVYFLFKERDESVAR